MLRCLHLLREGARRLPARSRRALSFTYPTPRKLDDIVRMQLLMHQDADAIKQIWTDYHASKPGVYAGVLTGKRKYEVLLQRAERSPFFVYPMVAPEGDGFSVLVSNFQGKHCLLTSYEDYQEKKTEAQPHLVITLYDELVELKDLILVRTDICNSAIGDDAARSVNRALLTNYLTSEGYDRVYRFNHEPNNFPLEQYLADVNNHC